MNILLDSDYQTQEEQAHEIPTAASLLEKATVAEEDWAKKIIEGMREHIIIRIKEEAKKGNLKYHFTTKEFPSFAKTTVLTNLISLAHQFEDKGFKISIDLYTRGIDSGYHFNICWSDDNRVPDLAYHQKNICYVTKDMEACK